MHISAKKET